MKNTTNTKDNKHKAVKLVIIFTILAALLAGLVIVGREGLRYYKDANALVDHAEGLKTELKALVTHIEKGNYEAANLSSQKIDKLSAEMRVIIKDERWQMIKEKAPQYGNDLDTAVKFLDVIDEASELLIKPGVQYLREKGLPDKSTFSKINPELGHTLIGYADLIDQFCPAIEKVLNDFNELPVFEMEKLESKVSKYRTLAKENTPDILIYLKFLKETSDNTIRPTAQFLIEKSSSLKMVDIDMEKIGPEMASTLILYADTIDKFVPIAEKALKDVNALPAFKNEKIEAKVSKYRQLAKDKEADILSLTAFAKDISDNVLRPVAEVLTRSPLSNLKTKKGDVDTNIIRDYLDLLDKVRPYLTKTSDLLKTNNLLKEHPNTTAKVSKKLDKAITLLDEYDDYIPYVKLLLGDGSDKLYLIIAQNSAEMRCSGGLPASIGVVTIKKGILHIGGFKPVLSVVPYKNKGINKFSKVEKKLFTSNWYANKVTAATVNPHFPRAAQIIANAYKKKHKKSVNGIISMTPAIVGRLIAITGPIKLSNGVKLNEKYAIKYLQRDVYFQYHTKKILYNKKAREQANKKENKLFAEAAKKVIKGTMSDLSLKSIMKLIDIVKVSSEDRVFCMWMANAEEQEVVKSLGCSGSLNYDAQKPEIGVFFSNKDANKLGIYVDIRVTVGKGKTNKDGSVTYPVTVKLKNNIDKKSLKDGEKDPYLTSKHGGNMRPMMYFFAPKGGKITSFKNNSKLKTKSATYQGLKVYYCPQFELKPKKTVTFKYNITTAPGVSVKPKVVTTPLLMAYRNAKAPK